MKKHLLCVLLALLIPAAGFLGYTAVYYHADERALPALESDGAVRVSATDYGWFFDGPAEGAALIFYPGGKVEAAAYAPLLNRLAAEDCDVCLVSMPLRLAVLAPNRADAVMAEHDYDAWYIGGHSLGGAVAGLYAASHPGELRGLALLAAYPTRPLENELRVVTICGTEDGVIDRERLAEAARYLPENAERVELPGGNHAQFGSYGPQRGDGAAQISPEEQWAQTAAILSAFLKG